MRDQIPESDACPYRMMNAPKFLGTWHCRTLTQYRSDELIDAVGEDDREPKPVPASRTEYGNATLEIREDGTYALTTGSDAFDSSGHWTLEPNRPFLVESDACTNGHERLESAGLDGEAFMVRFVLVPDAHDGLDILELSFRREPSPAPDPGADPLIAQLREAEEAPAMRTVVGESGRDEAEVVRLLWDSFVAGDFAANEDLETHWEERELLSDEWVTETRGGFTHDHAVHAMSVIDPDDDEEFAGLVVDMVATLDPDPKDEALAPLMTDAWLRAFVDWRSAERGPGEAFFGRPIFAQPRTDDVSRACVLEGEYDGFDAIAHLFPEGHPQAADAATMYRGKGLLSIPLQFIRERGIETRAREVALERIARGEPCRGLHESACLFATLLTIERGEPLPDIVLEAWRRDPGRFAVRGALNPGERTMVRDAIANLPAAQQESIVQRLRLS